MAPETSEIVAPAEPVPTSAKSEVSTPETPSLNVTVQETLAAFVGLDPPSAIELTAGAVTSHVTVLSLDVEAVLLLPAASVATPAATEAMTVPVVVMPVTATLYVEP